MVAAAAPALPAVRPRRRGPRRWPLYLLAIALSAFFILPIYLIAVAALSTPGQISAFPKAFFPQP
ncbi:MAG: hypothetical protein JO023_12760, partial [Chloroflexi bacterium]|nr:hypothetical protein [Chloroflexota bacterium]